MKSQSPPSVTYSNKDLPREWHQLGTKSSNNQVYGVISYPKLHSVWYHSFILLILLWRTTVYFRSGVGGGGAVVSREFSASVAFLGRLFDQSRPVRESLPASLWQVRLFYPVPGQRCDLEGGQDLIVVGSISDKEQRCRKRLFPCTNGAARLRVSRHHVKSFPGAARANPQSPLQSSELALVSVHWGTGQEGKKGTCQDHSSPSS